MKRVHSWFWSALLMGSLLAGCIPIVMVRKVVITIAPPQACTLIGCVNSLRVDVRGELPQPFDLEAEGSDGVRLATTCDLGRQAAGNAACDDPRISYDGTTITLPEVTAASVTLKLSWKGGGLEQTLAPRYETFTPNGPQCEPKCSLGQAELIIP